MVAIRFSFRWLYFFLGILAFCTVAIVGMWWVLWIAVGEEPATASRWISTFLGREVQIGHIDVSWRGLEPKLRLTEVRVLDPKTEQQLLSFREAYLGASPYRSLREGEWLPRHLTLIGGQLTVERKPEGCIRVHGLQSLESPCPDPPRLPAWLLELKRLTLVDVDIRWLDPALERKPLGLKVGELRLKNKGDLHLLEGKATLPEELGREITIKAKFTGRSIQDPESQGTLHLKGERLQLAPWQAHDFLYGLYFTRGTGNLELGLRWGKAALRQAVVKFDWKNLQVAGKAQGAEAPTSIAFQQLAGMAHYHPLAQGWSLKIPQLVVVRGGKAWPATALQVKMEREPLFKLQGQFTFLRLQDVAALFQLSDQLDPQLRLFLVETRPVGELRDVKLVLPLGEKQGKKWKFSANTAQLGVRPWQHWPGCQGLSFEVQLIDGGGQLHIDSRHVQLFSDDLEKPVMLDRLRGRITWLQKGGDWRVLADNVQLQNSDLALTAALRLKELPGANSPHLNLSLGLEKLDLAALSQYLPSRSMKPGLVRWLNQAFPKGGSAKGSLVFQGPMDRFPPSQDQGRFTAELDIHGTRLNYARGWPALEQVDAHLYSDGRHITIHAAEGQMFNAQVTEATVRLADLGSETIPLTVVGWIQGDAEDARRFIQHSPLEKKYGGFLKEIKLSGDTRLKLKLMMPLGKKKKRPEVDGELIFADAHLRQGDSPFLEFAAIKGSLSFTQAGLKAEGLVAQFLKQPIKVDLRSLSNQQGGVGVRLRLKGHLDAPRLAEKWFSSWSPWFRGAADFTAYITFQKAKTGGDKITTVRVSSALQGIEVALPPPLAKPADQTQQLLWELRGTHGDKKQITLTYGDGLQGVFEVTGSGQSLRLLKGKVRVGSGLPILPEQGAWLVGTLPQLSIDAWREVLTKATQGDSSKLTQLDHIALQIEQAELFGWHFGEVTVKANRELSHWQTQVSGPSLKGSITIPTQGSKGPLTADLDYLWLHSRSSEGEFQLAHPQAWPTLDLICRRCQFDSYDLGVIKVYASPYANGLHLEELEMVSPLMQLKASGDWTVHGEAQWSHLDIKAHSPDLGQLLTELDYQTNIAGGKAEVDIVAGWPGAPTLFDLERLDGSMRLTVGKGRLLNVEPGAGRLFGLLSVSTLPRRLALDFSDIFGKGFAFDRIQGTFAIRQGNAYSNQLVMEGPTARVQASGRIGLATQDYDQIIAVTPNVFSSLPLAGAVAGGPVGLGVGTAIMLADKLVNKMFGTQVGQLLTYYYTVSGPWAKPLVTRVNKLLPSPEGD
ncbi:YhdP family protein [Nitrosococcus wardiae]|uniref:TIGR02099 family protein n=1 Tax=Nitrosococcus wardiae TaxID=1814290 RepID=A0A4P7BY47_9GAMM|nr:YhdP family protein [Nitrosococcus wardiae]QBQ53326.1 TIGR02099 family protein [Nitrosococcus wardiae]